MTALTAFDYAPLIPLTLTKYVSQKLKNLSKLSFRKPDRSSNVIGPKIKRSVRMWVYFYCNTFWQMILILYRVDRHWTIAGMALGCLFWFNLFILSIFLHTLCISQCDANMTIQVLYCVRRTFAELWSLHCPLRRAHAMMMRTRWFNEANLLQIIWFLSSTVKWSIQFECKKISLS